MSENHLTEVPFDRFDLTAGLKQGIAEAGFVFCTPIQAATLPLALQGKDVAGQAQTGTGKTAAFLIATFHHLLSRPPNPQRKPTQPRALMLAPTRELAVQIHKDAQLLGKHTDFKLGLVFGGTGYEQQRKVLQDGVDVLIGTPGRLIDYFKQHVFDLRAIQVVVLDEADRMFDLGFIKDIRYLLRRMPSPSERQGLLFSATLSYRVIELAYEHMNNPQTVKLKHEQVTVERVTEGCYMAANEEKIPLLIGLLRHIDPRRTMVFVNTKRAAEEVWGFLEGNGFEAGLLSGDVPQNKRLQLLQRFQTGDLPILVGTDVAARGLHIPDVSHVINYDLPEDAEDYVHRIGRTARAGASGDAISFACERFSFSLPEIEAYIGHKLPVMPLQADLLPHIDPRSRKRTEHRRPPQGRHKPRGGGRGPRTQSRAAAGAKQESGERRRRRPRQPAKTE